MDCLREIQVYTWEDRSGKEQVRKECDHAMDEMRYFAATVVGERKEEFVAVAAVR